MSSAEAPRPWRITTAPRALSSGAPFETTGCLRCGLSNFLALFERWKFDPGQRIFDFGSITFEPYRKLEALAKIFDRLVSCKAGRISRDFKQNTARLAKINGTEILAVDDWRDVVLEFGERIPPLHLLIVCCRSPRHMMHGSDGNPSGTPFWGADEIDHAARHAVRNGVAEAVRLLCCLP